MCAAADVQSLKTSCAPGSKELTPPKVMSPPRGRLRSALVKAALPWAGAALLRAGQECGPQRPCDPCTPKTVACCHFVHLSGHLFLLSSPRILRGGCRRDLLHPEKGAEAKTLVLLTSYQCRLRKRGRVPKHTQKEARNQGARERPPRTPQSYAGV